MNVWVEYKRYDSIDKDGKVEDSGFECFAYDDYEMVQICSGVETFKELVETCNSTTIFKMLRLGCNRSQSLYDTAECHGGLYFCDEWVSFVPYIEPDFQATEEPKKYIIQELMTSGWEKSDRTVDGEPQSFKSIEDAQADLDSLIKETEEAFKAGNLAEAYHIEDFRIVEITPK